ncbi:MAG: phosphoribosyl-AMP cyclohydrolase, partial [Gammaproteobacteria bacterium]|nr:phosphoribosyl-AMP cyclohydrolase [Gammaproteobacteria bacterium]
MSNWLDDIKWSEDGLIPVIAQESDGSVVMFAFMNRDSLGLTLQKGEAVYWSRSRQKL